jgi:hypothetical protein
MVAHTRMTPAADKLLKVVPRLTLLRIYGLFPSFLFLSLLFVLVGQYRPPFRVAFTLLFVPLQVRSVRVRCHRPPLANEMRTVGR